MPYVLLFSSLGWIFHANHMCRECVMEKVMVTRDMQAAWFFHEYLSSGHIKTIILVCALLGSCILMTLYCSALVVVYPKPG